MSAPLRLVVCDDQALVRTGFVTIFSAQPDMIVVGEADNGVSAVEVVRRERPDVVVMDVRMPLLDGIEATRLIVGPGVEATTRVLVVTTFNIDEYVYDALQAGASGFLLKDARPAQLVEAVRTVAGGESMLAPAVTRSLIGHFADGLRPRALGGAELDDIVAKLTARELEVLQHLGAGRSNAEIAAEMFVAPETVKTYVSRIFAKLHLRDRVQAVVLAHRAGITRPGAAPRGTRR